MSHLWAIQNFISVAAMAGEGPVWECFLHGLVEPADLKAALTRLSVLSDRGKPTPLHVQETVFSCGA